MLLTLILIAVLATDIAVAMIFIMVRRSAAAKALPAEAAVAVELEETIAALRQQSEQAVAEIGRHKAHLRRLLADAERQQLQPGAGADAVESAVLRLARDGLSPRAIAGRAGISIEEVRLLLAMNERPATA
jgi:DNA-binding CsgD family transcriptional regulator